jgi:hypothetical protein
MRRISVSSGYYASWIAALVSVGKGGYSQQFHAHILLSAGRSG